MSYKDSENIRRNKYQSASRVTDIAPNIEIIPDVDQTQARKELIMTQYFLTGDFGRTLAACQGKLSGGCCTKEELQQYLDETSRDELAEYRRKAYEKIVDKQVSIVRMLQDAEFKKLTEILKNSNGKLDQVKTSDLAAAFKTNYQVLEFMQVFTANKDTITINNINVDADAIKKLEDMQ